MSKGFVDLSTKILDTKTLKREINIKSVLQYFNIEVENNKCLCPFHDDKNPSMLVNDESVHCFACGEGFDLFSFVQRKLDLTFVQAKTWLSENKDILPEVESSGKKRTRGGYRGPVFQELVEYYHSCLMDEHRDILHTKRLLTDETIDKNLIGWRPDFKAFSLPYWSGEPGNSEIAILQFRLTDKTPEDVFERTNGSKFIGLSGHNKPYLLNKHLLNGKWAVMVFGTFDGYLAAQDGFPATTPNGAGVFSTENQKVIKELQDNLRCIERLYVVFDKTESERPSVNKMLTNIQCEKILCDFPDGEWKDYGDYRLHKTPADFLREVLKWRLE
jgi:hypothetical protein